MCRRVAVLEFNDTEVLVREREIRGKMRFTTLLQYLSTIHERVVSVISCDNDETSKIGECENE
jgi:hypothetical protein